MNEKIRNRIIGGVVLVCLLIIVVPLLNAPPEEGDEAAVRTPPLPPSLQVPAAEEAVSADRRRPRHIARRSLFPGLFPDAPLPSAPGSER